MAAASGSRTTGTVRGPLSVHLSFRVWSFGPSRKDVPGSGGGAATVDRVGGPGDIACLVGGEECDDGSDLGRKAEPARGYAVDHFLDRRRRIAARAALEDRAQHAAVDQAGADAIDAHAGARAFPRSTLGEPDHRVLAGAVNGDVWRAQEAGNGSGVDDATLV